MMHLPKLLSTAQIRVHAAAEDKETLLQELSALLAKTNPKAGGATLDASAIFDAVMARNFPIVQGAVLVATGLYILVVLLSDLLIAWFDPRVRESL